MSGMGTVRKLLNVPRVGAQKRQLGMLDGRTKEARRLKGLRAIEDGSVHSRKPSVKIEIEDSEDEKKSEAEEREGTEAEAADGEDAEGEEQCDDSEFWKDLEGQEFDEENLHDEFRRTELRREAMRRKEVLDDFPKEALKRKDQRSTAEDEDVAKRMRTDFYAMVMMAASQYDLPKRNGQGFNERRCNSWMSRSELRSLRRLLQLPVKAARIHFAPRKRLQRPPNEQPRKRISVLLGEEPNMALLVQEEAEDMRKNPRRKAPFLWRGMTIFVDAQEKKGEESLSEVYVQKEGKTFATTWDPKKADLWYIFLAREKQRRLVYEVFLRRMKQNGKELDPKFFDKDEEQAFKQADQKEWQSWVDNGVMRLLTKEEASRVPSNKVFRISLRWVRVNKNKEVDFLSRLVAKSRLVVPGHADPGLGDFRSDAPTTNPIAVRLVKVLATSRSWTTMIFDVVFLSSGLFVRLQHFQRSVCQSTKGGPPIYHYDQGDSTLCTTTDFEISLWIVRGSTPLVSQSS